MCTWPAPFGWYCILSKGHHGCCILQPKRWNILGRLEDR